MKKSGFFLAVLSFLVFLSAFGIQQQGNAVPKIIFQLKSAQKTFSAGSAMAYTISVEDKEDGNSKYEEIATNEVFLELKFLQDSGKLRSYLEESQRDEGVLKLMKKGICFNCHALKKKMVGPSFSEVVSKYQKKPGLTDYLSDKIISGSKGIWGDSQVMPSHPELSKEQGKAIAGWITRHAADPDYEIQTGLEGKFSIPVNALPDSKSMFAVISSYLDHGISGQQAAEGRQVTTLAFKK
jgi:cytochrome c